MNTAASATTMTAEEIGRRVIKLVQSLRSPDDISPESIERHTGLTMAFNPTDKNRYGAGGEVDKNWHFSLVTVPDKSGTPPRRLTFTFDDRSADGKADLGPVCGLSFSDYRDALVSAGYKMQRIETGSNNDFWRFTRGTVDVSLWMLRYADPDKGPACVRSLDIRML